MDINFKNYKFKAKQTTSNQELEAYHSVKIFSQKVDDSILLLSLHGGGSFSLYLQDRFFNLNIDDETKKVSSFDGELVLNKIKFLKIKSPLTVKDVILILDTNEKLYPGTGSYIKFNTSKIIYDKEQKILQIGEINSSKITYKFFNNAYAQIEDGELLGLMFSEIGL